MITSYQKFLGSNIALSERNQNTADVNFSPNQGANNGIGTHGDDYRP